MTEKPAVYDPSDYLFDLAGAVVACLKCAGENIEVEHLLQGLPVANGELSDELVQRAAARFGYTAVRKLVNRLDRLNGPCIMKVGEGEYLLLIRRVGSSFICKDTTTLDGVVSLSKAELQLNDSVEIYDLRKTLSAVKESFGIRPPKGHWFWGLISSQKRLIIQIILSSVVANLLAVTVSLFALQVYDRVIPGQSEATLWVLAAGALLAIFFEAALRIARTAAIDNLGANVEDRLSKRLMAKVLGVNLDKRPMEPALTVNTLREFSSVREFFTTAAVGVVTDLPFAVFFLILIYFIASTVVFVIIAGAILIITPSLLFGKRMKIEAHESIGTMSAANRIVTEAVYSHEALKIDQAESHFQQIWENNLKLVIQGSSRQRFFNAILTYWGTSVQQITYIGGVIAGVYMVFSSEASIGSIIAVSILSTRTLSPVSQLSQIIAKWQNMKSALTGLETLVNAQQDRDEDRSYISRSRIQGDILVTGLKYSYPGSTTAALNVEKFHLKAGDRCALIGANGSGKTTMLRVIAGLITNQVGEITFDGLEKSQIDPIDLRNNIYYLPPDVRLFNGTLRRNLNMSVRYLADDKMMEALEFAGLGDFIRLHPEGLDMMLGDLRNLSAGQRQSIGLARAYLKDPSILIMDEPTSALDQGLEKLVVSRLDKWIGNRTCLLATHRPMILSMISTVAIVDAGKIKSMGPRDEILQTLSKPSIHTVSAREH